jgi:hypothetical protein
MTLFSPGFEWWPNSHHEDFDYAFARTIRRAMAEGWPSGVIMYEPPPTDAEVADYFAAELPTSMPERRPEMLTIDRIAAPAPYTGRRPFRYMWKVAHDNHGRWVAGPVHIWFEPEDPWDVMYQATTDALNLLSDLEGRIP